MSITGDPADAITREEARIARLETELKESRAVSWKDTLLQYTGRLHRLYAGKTEVRIYDYVDREVPMLLRMFEKRLRGYRAIGYARGSAPVEYEELNTAFAPTGE